MRNRLATRRIAELALRVLLVAIAAMPSSALALTPPLPLREPLAWPLALPLGGDVALEHPFDEIADGSPIGHHTGIDLSAPAGAPVLAAADGTVVLVLCDDEACGLADGNDRGLGYTVILRHKLGRAAFYTQYSQLGSIESRVRDQCGPLELQRFGRCLPFESGRPSRGLRVRRGEVIARTGCTDGGPCDARLHFSIRDEESLRLPPEDPGNTVCSTFLPVGCEPGDACLEETACLTDAAEFTIQHAADRSYRDPILHFHDIDLRCGEEAVVTALGDGAAARLGPDSAYRTATLVNAGDRLRVLAASEPGAGGCAGRWLQVEAPTSSPRFVDDADPVLDDTPGTIPSAWICSGPDGARIVDVPAFAGETDSGVDALAVCRARADHATAALLADFSTSLATDTDPWAARGFFLQKGPAAALLAFREKLTALEADPLCAGARPWSIDAVVKRAKERFSLTSTVFEFGRPRIEETVRHALLEWDRSTLDLCAAAVEAGDAQLASDSLKSAAARFHAVTLRKGNTIVGVRGRQVWAALSRLGFLEARSIATCGDGVLDAGEQCDDGNSDERDSCQSWCQATVARPHQRLSLGGNLCWLDQAGAVHCAGLNFRRSLEVPSGEFTSLRSSDSYLAGSYYQTCATRADGTEVCWGGESSGAAPAPGEFVEIAGGYGLRADGTTARISDVGRFDGLHRQDILRTRLLDDPPLDGCGLAIEGDIVCPNPVPPKSSARAIGTRYRDIARDCVLKRDGSVVCGATGGEPIVAPPGTFTEIATTAVRRRADYCGLRTDGSPSCWKGLLRKIALGDIRLESFADGMNSTIFTTADRSARGYLFIPGDQPAISPLDVPADVPYLDSGYPHLGRRSCGLRADGSGICGGGYPVVFAAGPYVWSGTQPMPQPPAGEFTQISTGLAHACGLRPNGEIECTQVSPYPPPPGPFVLVRVGVSSYWGFAGFVTVTVNDVVNCGIRADASIDCWGPPASPLMSPPSGSFVDLFFTQTRACAIRDDASLACWGTGSFIALNPPPGEFVEVAVEGDHTCGLHTDGTLSCWGDADSDAAVPAGSYVDLIAFTGGGCAIDVAGFLACWGEP